MSFTLFVLCCLFCDVWFLLFVVCCLARFVCCSLFVGRVMSLVVCCLLVVVVPCLLFLDSYFTCFGFLCFDRCTLFLRVVFCFYCLLSSRRLWLVGCCVGVRCFLFGVWCLVRFVRCSLCVVGCVLVSCVVC